MTARAEEAAKRKGKAPDLVVVSPLKSWTCAECSGTGDFLTMDDAGPLCLSCADLDHLVYLPAGDAALTRRAKKASGLSAVVVRFSRARRRYERQGILVEEEALDQAERECLADEESRTRRKQREQERRAEADVEWTGWKREPAFEPKSSRSWPAGGSHRPKAAERTAHRARVRP